MTVNPFMQLTVCSLVLLITLGANLTQAGQTTRVSVASDGTQGNWYSLYSSLSADGRWVAFESQSSNLVTGDTNGTSDIFVHDRQTKTTNRVSVASDGKQGNSGSYGPSLSADGRWVAFASYASNLVSGDTNNNVDIFLHDRLTHKTTRVSVASDGTQGNGTQLLFSPSLSADGRWVAFTSDASNLVSGDTNNAWDVFLHDRLTHKTTRVSVASDGTQGNDYSTMSDLSADGRWVAFSSLARNLVAGDTNSAMDVFLHDRLTHQTTRVSVASDGSQVNDDCYNPSLSANGRWVAFASWANNLVTGDTNGSDVFLHDRLTHQTSRVSVASDGTQGNTFSGSPSLSADGRWVAFASDASNLVAGDTNSTLDVFLHDRRTRQTTRISVASNGAQVKTDSLAPFVSADGRWVAFESLASKLVAGDTNAFYDIFVRDRSLVNGFQGDLAVTATQKPASLTLGGAGSYVFNIANKGPDAIEMARLTHLISNGKITALTPSQGSCKRYTTVALCTFGLLNPGQSLTLTAQVKAIRNSISQQLSVSSAGRADPAQANNYLTVTTPVTP